jgi:hypothetical protein
VDAVRLAKLLITESSSVDDPANESPGWIVQKAAGSAPDAFLLVAQEMELVTKASASKEPYGDVKYADPGYQEDKKKRYPLDTETHIRAAWSYVNQADNAGQYSAGDLAKVKAAIKAAMKGIGADVEKDASPIVAKIREFISVAPPEGKDDIEMDAAELTSILDEREDALVAKFADAVAVAKSVEAPAPTGEVAPVEAPAPAPEAAPAVESIVAPGLTAEDVTKGVETAIQPLLEVIDKALDRIENVETALGYAARKSIEGQESNDAAEGEVKTPDLADAISKAFRNPASRR